MSLPPFPTDPLAADESPPELEELSADFEVEEELGRGGTAVVYKARERALDRLVAIKVIRAPYVGDDDLVARLEREARLVARLHHPNVVTLLGVRRLRHGSLALIMHYVHGHTLRDELRRAGALPAVRAEAVLRDVGTALQAAHAHGVVHRDVKPENIYVELGSHRALLADFGAATPMRGDLRLTMAGMAIGTPGYMAPELIDGGEPTAASDVYGLGLVGWEMLAGRAPWQGESLFAILSFRKQGRLPALETLRSDIPPGVLSAIEGALQADPAERWPDMATFLAALASPGRRSWRRWLATRDEDSALRRPVKLAVPASPVGPDQATRRLEQPASDGAVAAARQAVRPTTPLLSPTGARAASGPDVVDDDDDDAPLPPEPVARRRRPVLLQAAVLLLVVAASLFAVKQWQVGGRALDTSLTSARTDAPRAQELVVRPEVQDPFAMTPAESAAAALAVAPPASVPADSILPPGAAASPNTLAPPAAGITARGGEVVRPRRRRTAAAPSPSVIVGGTSPISPPVESEPTRPLPAAAAPAVSAVPSAPVVTTARTVSVGGLHSCAVLTDGQLRCWGGNDRGQLGDLPGDERFTAVTAGLTHSCAVTTAGRTLCWGANDRGQLGDGTRSSHSAPHTVRDLPRPTTLALGAAHSCALAADGIVRCWGANDAGQLGTGDTRDRTTVTPVAGDLHFGTLVSGWRHACGLAADGRAYCWGDNTSGQLGDGSTTDRDEPTPVNSALRFRALAAGRAHTCGLATDGGVYCWGRNDAGQLGTGQSRDASTPRRVSVGVGVRQLAAGSLHSCALGVDGTVRCWGQNRYGQLGDGTTFDRDTPVTVRNAPAFVQLDASGGHSCGRTAANELYCWGYNLFGQLGDGTRENRTTPVLVRFSRQPRDGT